MGIWKANDHIQIKIKMPNPSQEPPDSSKALNVDLKDLDVLCTFKIMIERWNLQLGCIKDQGPYPNQDQDAKPKSGTSRIPQSPKWGLKGHRCSMHLRNQDKEPKFRSYIFNLWSQRKLLWIYWKVRTSSLSPHMGLWRMLEVPDLGLASWSWFGYGHSALIQPWSIFQLSILI